MAFKDTTVGQQERPLQLSAGGVESHSHGIADATLRALVGLTTMAGVIVMLTSKQTKQIQITPTITITKNAKFNHSPSYIYYVAALSVACLYSIIMGASSVLVLKKTEGSYRKLQIRTVILDTLIFAIVVAATGATTGVAYIGLRGNHYSNWHEICTKMDVYCHHLAASIALSIISSIELLLLIWLAFYILFKKIGGLPKY